jgi:uncharacterized protein YutE (UPF0331/DUF86 family)
MDFDADRLAKNKAEVLRIHAQVERLVSVGRDEYLSDSRNALAARYLLVALVAAIADTCQHLLSKANGIACEGYVDCILEAGERGIVSVTLANRLRGLANLRNSLIHRYGTLGDAENYRLCREHAGEFPAFVREIERFTAW